jgi:hypothetical protein
VPVVTDSTIKVSVVVLHWEKVSAVVLQWEKVSVVDLYGRLRDSLMNRLTKFFLKYS